MDRYLVPRLGALLVAGMATVLVGVIVLRSPDTHANLWPELRSSYDRTAVAVLGEERAWYGPSAGPIYLVRPSISLGRAAGIDPGRRAYLQAGCATCHGLEAQGGPVGASLAGALPETVRRIVREGPGGMPTYEETRLSETALDELASYLQGLGGVEPSAQDLAGLRRLAYEPSVPLEVLLRGKVALRQSCGACHPAPSREEILSAFATDDEVAQLVAQMVQETNLQLEEARLITYYMLAVRHGADPVKAP